MSNHKLISFLFLRFLGGIYLIAFLSLLIQITGLIGNHGILPVKEFLASISSNTNTNNFLIAPTVCWLNSDDVFLNLLCIIGAIFSVLLIFNFTSIICLVILWFTYLSLTIACQTFLSFQWDNLLLETGFLCIFLAPIRLNLKQCQEPPQLIIFLFNLLLFKLMFFSGLVKIASGDIAWKTLTALNYHYQTQPIPNIISYFTYWTPSWFHKLCCLTMFTIELIVPFFIFGKKSFKLIAFTSITVFQIIIFATGNYCFFNILAILLCLFLLNDEIIQRIFPRLNSNKSEVKTNWLPKWIIVSFTVLTIVINSVHFSRILGLNITWPQFIGTIYIKISPFRIINNYGLFSIMTTTRPEIIIEGSNDFKIWKPYEFKYKPGRTKTPPPFIAPHQPRLDWQMWFAALGSFHNNPWFIRLCVRLLQDSKDVINLLEKNPFPKSPPKYLRALIYDYRFSNLYTLKTKGIWWERELKGLYLPVVTLIGDKLTIIPDTVTKE